MPSDMRALVLRHDGVADKGGYVGNKLDHPGDYIELANIPRPAPGPGQVLIKVRRAAINPSDIAFVQGFYGQARQKGRPAGFEGVGKVVDAGPGLMGRLLKGRDVSFYATPDGSGAWAEYAVTQAAVALPVKKGVADRDAAALIINPVTAAAMLDMVGQRKAFVFSAAASQLGKFMASLSRDQRKKMIALVRREESVPALLKLGASHVLNQTSAGYEEELARVLGEARPAIFFDAAAGSASARVHQAMGANARWIIYGKLDTSPAEIRDPTGMIFRNKSVEGFWATTWAKETSFVRKLRILDDVQKRFRDGRWSTDVSVEIPLGQAIERLGQALSRKDGKVQLVLSED